MMKILIQSLSLGSLITGSSLLYAAPVANELSKSFHLCSENANGIIEQAACLSNESDFQENRLKRIYTGLQSKLSSEQKEQLVISQQKWMAAKESDSILETIIYDHSQPENLQMKLNEIKRVKARADQLEQYLTITQ